MGPSAPVRVQGTGNASSSPNGGGPGPTTVGPTNVGTDKLFGVRGWLLFFVVCLVVIAPLYSLISAGGLVTQAKLLANIGQGFEGKSLAFILYATAGLVIGLAAWGAYCGIQIYKLRPLAIKITKRMLLISFVVGSIWAIGIAVVLSNAAIYREVMAEVARSAIGVAIWYWYLSKSKRVAITFPQ